MAAATLVGFFISWLFYITFATGFPNQHRTSPKDPFRKKSARRNPPGYIVGTPWKWPVLPSLTVNS